MSEGEPLPIAQVRSIALQIGDALTFLHGKGILHRDLKPENILMPTESLVKVGDFGIAVMQDKAGLLTQSVRGMGTVGYVSPEQQYGLKVDERTDQYSLAALCYELLTGKRPLGLFPPPSQLNPQLTRQLDSVVLKGLSDEPKNRFRSVQEFVSAVEQALAASSRKARVLPGVLMALFAFLVVAAGLAWIARHRSKSDVATPPGRPQVESVQIPPGPNPVMPPVASNPAEPAATTPEQSAEFKKLVELRAYTIWVEHGRPEGEEENNWLEAERETLDRVKKRAFELWKKQGRPKDEAGAAVRDKNIRDSISELLKKTDEELRRHPLD
jgi:serine/threonine protein kinase